MALSALLARGVFLILWQLLAITFPSKLSIYLLIKGNSGGLLDPVPIAPLVPIAGVSYRD